MIRFNSDRAVGWSKEGLVSGGHDPNYNNNYSK